MVGFYLAAVLASALSCGDREEAPASTRPARRAPRGSEPAIAGVALPDLSVRLASAAAFDLVPTSTGALLAWGRPGACGLRLLSLDARGRPLAAPRELASGGCPGRAAVSEVALAAGGGELGLAWLLEDADSAGVMASYGRDSAAALSPPARISAAAPGSEGASRGRLALAADDGGRMSLLFRSPSGPCRVPRAGARSSEQARCAHYVARAHPGPRARSERGIEEREVPLPCPMLLGGAAFVSGAWFHAICSGSPPRSTVFVIRPEISYAQALEVLRGCDPLGLSSTAEAALVLGRCDDGLAVRKLGHDGTTEPSMRGVTRHLHCRDGRPQLTLRAGAHAARKSERSPARGARARLEVLLAAPRGELAALLPRSLADGGSRAVWTGERLLVATPAGGGAGASGLDLTLSAHRCEQARLRSQVLLR